NERVEWQKDGEPTLVDYCELKRTCAKLAAAALLTRHWPAKGGRHHASLALAGGLLRSNWSEDAGEHFVCQIAQMAGDEEGNRRRANIGSTSRRIGRHEPTTGQKTCTQIFGDKVWTRVRDWLQLRTSPGPVSNNAVMFPFRLTENAVEYAEERDDQIDW